MYIQLPKISRSRWEIVHRKASGFSEQLIQNHQFQDLKDTDDLLTSGIIDSLGLVKLLTFIDDKYSISIEDREIVPENFESIQAISNMINERLN